MSVDDRFRSHLVEPKPHGRSPFEVGGDALVKGSFEVVTVKAVTDDTILVERAGGQTTYSPNELEPFDPDFCPLP